MRLRPAANPESFEGAPVFRRASMNVHTPDLILAHIRNFIYG